MKISTVTQDYIANVLTAPPEVDVVEAAYLRLATQKGSYFAGPNLGSELYRLKRSKDKPRIRLQAINWATQALEPLKSRYFLSSITVVEQTPINKGVINLLITLTHKSGKTYKLTHSVKVSG